MIKKSLFLICVLFTLKSSAQNLVPNFGFEQYDFCPDDINQISYATGWFSFGNSPDYFNSCDITNFTSVPYNLLGYQMAANGAAYCGVITYFSGSPNIREFVGIELTSPLVIGQKYFVSFYASATVTNNPETCYATNKLGVKFSTVSYDAINMPPIDNIAQVYSNSIISDTSNWTRIIGSFIADSTYAYLIIGNFFDDNNTDTSIILNDTNIINWCRAYYYLDEIYVSTDSINGLSERPKENIFIAYPNPAKNEITIKCQSLDYKYICLQNLLGQTIIEKQLSTTEEKIDISFIPSGMYFIKLINNKHDFSIQKIFITN